MVRRPLPALCALFSAALLVLAGCGGGSTTPRATWHGARQAGAQNRSGTGPPDNTPGHVGSTPRPPTPSSPATPGKTPPPASPSTSPSAPAVESLKLGQLSTGSADVALTFDDGPSSYTPQILALLRQYHVKATFCLIGVN